jgi:hypothetical protein
MPTDAERRELYGALEHTLGAVPATTLMDLLPPVGWADVARRSDVDNLRIELGGELAELRGEIAKLNGRFDGLIPRVMLANIPLMFGVAGLVLAAAKLA